MGRRKKGKKLLIAGGAGSIVAAICCFTPVLVWIFTAIGVTTAVAYLDLVLLPVLLLFLAMTLVGYFYYREEK